MIFFPSSIIDLFVVPSHLYDKKITSPFQRYRVRGAARTFSSARDTQTKKKKEKTHACNNIPENSNFLGRRKEERGR